jgi:hypothetical protein
MPELWSDTVWVFVDYNNAGVMERLPLLPGATLTATSAEGVGKVKEEPGNNQGVWVMGNARNAGSFSATVQLPTAVSGIGGACVYGSNYPPVGKYTTATNISFTGTPDYKVILERNDKSTYTATVGKNELLLIPSGEAVLSFTDATGALGRLKPIPPPYAASAQIWTIANQTWSDVINVPECDHDAFTNSHSVAYCRSLTTDGGKWYYYNWPYVNAKKNTLLCPSPWRVPTVADCISLDIALGGTGENREGVDVSWIEATYMAVWGGDWWGAISQVDVGNYVGWTASMHASSVTVDGVLSYALSINNLGGVWPQLQHSAEWGFVVRCVM